ncbi:transmembrane efflux protein [Salmonella enterica subsp. enterica]|uniref:Transmembrane efflux protein n=1 Tax=Salmonella enterica I TaxID=59201 RepID=A0A379X4Q6_SALET|nr:transmembrane efflux protein [Salmonella enterica subsp. enterica]
MMPVARLALLRAYPRSELLPVLNFVTMPGLVGPILGPVLGGVLVTWASWHWIFLIIYSHWCCRHSVCPQI